MSFWSRAILLVCGLSLALGCATQRRVEVDRAGSAYVKGDYAAAYRWAVPVAVDSSSPQRHEAAYLAGLAAYQLRDLGNAERYLSLSRQSTDPRTAGDSMATLGMVLSEQSRYDEAAQSLEQAAGKLDGRNRVNAWYYAGIARQKLGQWTQGYSDLQQAWRQTTDPAMRQTLAEQMRARAFAIQTGAFAEVENARRAAQAIASKTLSLGLGLPRLMRSTDANGKPLTLVHVGRFGDYASAGRMMPSLGTPDAVVVAVTR
ncbi:MAG: hypothetical protein GC164_12945 [Phycisphaera sp.]|nr:hypothetical protein [Phycisphaera sp.]